MKTPDSHLRSGADHAHLQQRAKEYTTPVVAYNKMPYNDIAQAPNQIRTLRLVRPDAR